MAGKLVNELLMTYGIKLTKRLKQAEKIYLSTRRCRNRNHPDSCSASHPFLPSLCREGQRGELQVRHEFSADRAYSAGSGQSIRTKIRTSATFRRPALYPIFCPSDGNSISSRIRMESSRSGVHTRRWQRKIRKFRQIPRIRYI